MERRSRVMNDDGNKKIPKEAIAAIRDIVWMARRYAEGRKTGATWLFNRSYDILKKYINFKEKDDPDNRQDKSRPIKNFPYATEG